MIANLNNLNLSLQAVKSSKFQNHKSLLGNLSNVKDRRHAAHSQNINDTMIPSATQFLKTNIAVILNGVCNVRIIDSCRSHKLRV
jgi:mitochondrial fission protein ELM1